MIGKHFGNELETLTGTASISGRVEIWLQKQNILGTLSDETGVWSGKYDNRLSLITIAFPIQYKNRQPLMYFPK
jgi:hypothetical protein